MIYHWHETLRYNIMVQVNFYISRMRLRHDAVRNVPDQAENKWIKSYKFDAMVRGTALCSSGVSSSSTYRSLSHRPRSILILPPCLPEIKTSSSSVLSILDRWRSLTRLFLAHLHWSRERRRLSVLPAFHSTNRRTCNASVSSWH